MTKKLFIAGVLLINTSLFANTDMSCLDAEDSKIIKLWGYSANDKDFQVVSADYGLNTKKDHVVRLSGKNVLSKSLSPDSGQYDLNVLAEVKIEIYEYPEFVNEDEKTWGSMDHFHKGKATGIIVKTIEGLVCKGITNNHE